MSTFPTTHYTNNQLKHVRQLTTTDVHKTRLRRKNPHGSDRIDINNKDVGQKNDTLPAPRGG